MQITFPSLGGGRGLRGGGGDIPAEVLAQFGLAPGAGTFTEAKRQYDQQVQKLADFLRRVDR